MCVTMMTRSYIYINADDTKATARISNSTDSQNFQLELNEKIYPWAPSNNMALNGDKFEHLQVGKKL